jgi:hypothetical protein
VCVCVFDAHECGIVVGRLHHQGTDSIHNLPSASNGLVAITPPPPLDRLILRKPHDIYGDI